jgi:BASS family bile acid:Na+ symporter
VNGIDAVRLNFSPATLHILNAVLGLVMFGVALELRVDDFKRVLERPRPVLIGLAAHFLVLPAFTYLLIRLVEPRPSVALGMLIVACCPAGNLSNWFTHLGKGNTALSVSISSMSTLLAVVLTPFNFQLWASLYAPTAAMLHTIAVPLGEMFSTIFVLLAVPLAAGIFVTVKYPRVAERLRTPMKRFAIGVFGVFVVGALAANWSAFVTYVGGVVGVVAFQNAAALAGGYFTARAFRLPERDCRAVAFECGIQNSGLGLILTFTFFAGLGGMAIVAAWWGIWHLIAGMTLAQVWARRDPGAPAIATAVAA